MRWLYEVDCVEQGERVAESYFWNDILLMSQAEFARNFA
jgi:hypothetical protein